MLLEIILNFPFLYLSLLPMAAWLGYCVWLLVRAATVLRDLVGIVRFLALAAVTASSIGLVLFVFLIGDREGAAPGPVILSAIVLLGSGVGVLAYIAGKYDPTPRIKISKAIIVGVGVATAVASLIPSESGGWDLYGNVFGSFIAAVTVWLLILTALYFRRISIQRRSLAIFSWAAIASVPWLSSASPYIFFLALSGLALLLPSAKPIINSQKISRFMGIVSSILLIVAGLIFCIHFLLSLRQGFEPVILGVALSVLLLGAMSLVGTYLKAKTALVLAGAVFIMLSLAGMLLKGVAPLYPILPVSLLLVLSGLSIDQAPGESEI